MLPYGNCNIQLWYGNYIQKKTICLAVLSVGAMFIASFASSTHSGLANAQQNKTSMQPQGGQNTQAAQS